eukprot:6329796-Amphidinium_carterae.1
MVAPTQAYPSEGGSPPKNMANACRGDTLWDGSGPPGISAWSKPAGGAPAPEGGGGSGSGWQGYIPPSGNNPVNGDPPPPPGQDPYRNSENITSMPAAAVRQSFEEWVARATLAVTTWTLTMTARDHFVLVVKEARKNLKVWQNGPHQEKLKMELSYLHGAERPAPPR